MGVQMALGGSVAWNVEFDAAPSKVLAFHDPTVPNYGDITTVDWAAVEPVDILTGGFPCQDLSHAGKRLGLRPGTRSGLWEHFAYAINELRPRMVVIENVRGLLSASAHCELERDCWCVGDEREPALRALGAVLGDLAELGYDARWGGVRAADAGAPHGRFRVFIVASPANADGSGGHEAVERDGRGTQGGHWSGVPHQPDRDADGAGPIGVTLLPTATNNENRQSLDRYGPNLGMALKLLPTPSVADGTGGHVNRSGARSDELPLPGIASHGTFGPYAPAIARWEAVLGRPAPSPTEPGKDGRPRLSPLFVEWMMGLPAGHVIDPAIGLTRAQQLKALGNGVVPQQAALALRLLLGLGGGVVGGSDMATLKTPTAQLAVNGGSQHPDKRKAGGHGPTLADEIEHLLPTPAVNDMGAGKTPADWDAWTARMKGAHGNGNGHGKSLEIEALRLGVPDELA
jgi:DNA (cytosine-5)-methyltransferase 1